MDLLLKKAALHSHAITKESTVNSTSQSSIIPCFIKIDPQATASIMDIVTSSGGKIIAHTHTIIAAHVPDYTLGKLSSHPDILHMEYAPPLQNKMNSARQDSNIISVQDGSHLGTAYKGDNVVVGIIDDAIDYGHADFLNADGTTRIQYLEQDGTSCYKQHIDSNNCSISNGGQGAMHGTHVTGIAAGSDQVYTGVAPNADIIFMFYNMTDAATSGSESTSFSTNILYSAAKIFEKADELDKPCVINISLGTSIGAHDGSSLLEQGLYELVHDKPGRIIVNAAGNEQANATHFEDTGHFNDGTDDMIGGIHASINVADGQAIGHRMAIWKATSATNTFTDGTLVDLWLSENQSAHCKISVFAYNHGREDQDFTFPGLTSTDDATLAMADIAFSDDSSRSKKNSNESFEVSLNIDASDTSNAKPHAQLIFTNAATYSPANLENYWYDIVIEADGGDCNGHMWLYIDHPSIHDFLKNIDDGSMDVADGTDTNGYALADGDSLYTLTVPSTAKDVIAVGSYLAQKPAGSGTSQWISINGTTYSQDDTTSPGGTGSTVSDLSIFSSLGPTADNRSKPEIIAPGEPIISALASSASTSESLKITESFYKSAGTSMAAPFITGVVALLLDRNDSLTPTQVISALQSNAITSGLNSKTTNAAHSYGAGKINGAEALASIAETTDAGENNTQISTYKGTGDLSSPSSCSLSQQSNQTTMPIIMIISLIFIGIQFMRRLKNNQMIIIE